MTTQQHSNAPETPEQQIDVTAAEWLMIIVTGFTGVFAGPLALFPGTILLGMFTYRVNPELMRNTAAGKWVRGLLPAPTATDQAASQSNTSASMQRTAQSAIGIIKGSVATPGKQLAMIDLAALAKCSTILLVGSRGSGKSTLLRALLQARKQYATIAVYDPHAAPDDWPMATLVHNSEQTISSGLVSAYKRLQARKDERRKGIRLNDWPKLTLAADEWGSIVASVKLPEAIDRTPGEVSTELMKEGRKFGIGFVAGAHGFTNKSLGCAGDQEAFLQSFDWIIQLGGFTRKLLEKQYADLFAEIPMGTNEEGGTFPLIVACVSPSTGELRLLDMRGLDKMVNTSQRKLAPALPWHQEQKRGESELLTGMLSTSFSDHARSLSDMKATAPESETTIRDLATDIAPTVEETAYITRSLSLGMSATKIVRSMKGYKGTTHKEYMAKVAYVKHLLDAQPASDTNEGSTDQSADDEEEPPPWFGKPFDE